MILLETCGVLYRESCESDPYISFPKFEGRGKGWSVKALGTFFLLHYITLHYMVIIFSPVSFQALRDDVRRQTDRENHLQTRYSNLLYERGATYSQMQHR